MIAPGVMATVSRYLLRPYIRRVTAIVHAPVQPINLQLQSCTTRLLRSRACVENLVISRHFSCLARSHCVGICYTDVNKCEDVQSEAFFSTTRTNAKGKNKGNKKDKKGGKGGGSGDIFKTMSRDDMSNFVDYEEMRDKMARVVQHLQQQLLEKITIRSNPAAYDNIPVDTPDGRFKLMELGQIIQKNPTIIAINLDAAPQYIKEVKKALADSGLNINPQQEGTSLFIPVPKVTREHREGLAKNAKALFSKNKESLQQVEKKFTKELKSKTGIPKDDITHAQDVLVNTTKAYVQDLDQLVDAKIKELLGS